MDWTLEVVVVPVSDVDRAKAFYADEVGFAVDHDTRTPNGRIVQLTPPGSGCSIVIGDGSILPTMAPGSVKGLQLVVADVQAAHDHLVARGVTVTEVQRLGENPGPGGPLDNVGFVFFEDPDGNASAVQQISYER